MKENTINSKQSYMAPACETQVIDLEGVICQSGDAGQMPEYEW